MGHDMVQSPSRGEPDLLAWTNVPTSLLQSELARRQGQAERPECGSGSDRGSYNTPLHVFALFLILILSVLACSFPIIVRRFPTLPVPHHFLFLSRHFGTGVLIATAFVHLLPTAFVSLTDPCLPPFWNRGYPAMAGLIAMTSVLIVVGIEMFFATRGAGHMHGSEYDTLGPEDAEGMPLSAHRLQGLGSPAFRGKDNMRPFRQWKIGDGQGGALSPGITYDDDDDDIPHTGRTLAPPTGPVLPNGLPKFTDDETTESDLEFDEMNIVADEAGLLSAEQGRTRTQSRRDDPPRIQLSNGLGEESPERHGSQAHLSEMQEQRKLLLQCLLLEAGILFHSVFIGMALSVATGTSFIVLLVAISFHQTFEGLALGSRIAAITSLPPTSPKPWLMALAYGTTTPLGQAIGLLVHKLYDPASQTGLLTVGVMNAISSGLLLFAGLVELLAEDFLSDKSYEMLRGRPRIEACASVVGGAFLMALVGAWA